MIENLTQHGETPPAATLEPGNWHARLMSALACASEGNWRQVNLLARIGAVVVLSFEIVSWWEVAHHQHPLLEAERPFFIFDIALLMVFLGFTCLSWFRRRWREIAMACGLALVASRTLAALAVGQDEPLLLALIVLILGGAVLIPWSVAWQGSFTVAGLIAFTIIAVTGEVEPLDLHRWLALLAIGAFALSFTALKGHYRGQTILIGSLLDRERRLARSQKILRTLFDAVPDIVTLTRFGDGRLLEVNEESLRRAGMTREQALSTTVVEMAAWVRPHERESYIRRLAAEGRVRDLEVDFRFCGVVTPYLMSSVVVEIEGERLALNVARDATQIKESERALRVAHERLRDQVERLTAAEARLRNEVADRHRAQERMAKSEALLRLMFDAIPDIVITRRGDAVADVNEEFVKRSGVPREEAIGCPMERATLFRRAADRAEFLRQIKTEGIVQNFQADLLLKGVAVPYLVSGAMVETDDGPVIFSISRDISSRIHLEHELVAAREAALAASQAKSEFLSSMSHEIRTPMNAILGMAELLGDGPLSAEQRRYVNTMRSNGNVLLRLINDILDLAKIESGRLSLESVGFDLEDVVERALETSSVQAHAKRLELVARVPAQVAPRVVGDPLRLRQILVNLIANAVKFTQQGEVVVAVDSLSPAEAGRLGLNVAPAQGADGADPTAWLRFSVADTGIGIAAGQLETIFSSFTQADASVTRRFGGSGLGLAIVRRLSEMMGGRVEVESQPGRGSTFRVIVPLRVDRRPEISEREHLRALISLDDIRTLIVDDNAANRLALREMLERSGARVTEAAGGAEALAELARARACGDRYHLMLIDYQMPGMNGIEVARRAFEDGLARSSENGRDTAILMLTSEDLNSTLAQVRRAGLHTYLIKPIKRVELLGRIAEVLRGPAAAPELAQPPAAPREESGPMNILLAEDSPDNRFLVQAYLKKFPYRIDVAENGRLAVEKFKASPPDLVLMDVQMPELDGLGATRAIRLWERERNLGRAPIIALTASALDDDVKRAFEAGCDQHVSKPVRKAALLAAIRKALESPGGRAARSSAAPPSRAGADSRRLAQNPREPRTGGDLEDTRSA